MTYFNVYQNFCELLMESSICVSANQQTGAAEAKELPKTHSIPRDLLPKVSSMGLS